MVLVTRNASVATSGEIPKKSKIFMAILLAIVCLIATVLLITMDPIHAIVNYNLRLKPGSFLFNKLKNEFKGVRLSIYLFNISNADRFMAGEDRKMKLDEVGPFVYQEYRWYEDMEMSKDDTEMTMTSRIRSEFVSEESIANPKDINVTVANLPMLSIASIISNYPSFMHFMFNNIAYQTNSKAIMNIDVHSYFWGYKTPLMTLGNKLLPGVLYFDSFGLMDRFYDKGADYRIIAGATSQDRFGIKSVKKYRHLHQGGIDDVQVSEQAYSDTYEGLVYPPELTPDVPINWYRIPFCKTFKLEHTGSKSMDYGGEGLVYTISNSTFQNEQNFITKKMHLDGLMDISECYFGLPFVVSKSHFLDADPRLLESVDGLMPDREKYPNQVIIDRRAAITFDTMLSLQLNMMVDGISFNREVGRFSSSILPILRVQVDQPRMANGIMMLFYLAYKILPWFLIILETTLVIVSLLLIASSVRSMSLHYSYKKEGTIFEFSKSKKYLTETQAGVPLVSYQKNA